MKELGADIADKNTSLGLSRELEDIIAVSNVVFAEESEDNIESVLNSIVSLIIQVPQTDPSIQKLVNIFCEKLVQSPSSKMGLLSLRVLQNLFEGLGENKSLRYDVYFTLITIAGKTNQIHLVSTDIEKIKTWFTGGVGVEKFQNLYRLLHEVLIQTKNRYFC